MKATKLEQAIVIRDVESVEELRAIEELQLDVWGRDSRDAVPLTQFVAARAVGGHVIGAFAGEEIAGFAYAFIGLKNNEVVLHSHKLAVRQEYREHRLGQQLKFAQRSRALQQGLRRMTWTFDPLQSKNAHLNFRRLGVLADDYRINFYGAQGSSFLHQNGTDRFFVSWLLDSPRVNHRIESATDHAPHLAATDDNTTNNDAMSTATMNTDQVNTTANGDDIALLVQVTSDDAPQLNEKVINETLAAKRAYVEVPFDINRIQREDSQLAMEWRTVSRRAFTACFAAGFVVTDFKRAARRDGQAYGVYQFDRGTLHDFAATR